MNNLTNHTHILQGLPTAWHNMSFLTSFSQIKLLSGHTTMRLCFPTHPATGVIPRSPMGIDLANQFTARKAIEVQGRIQPLNQKKHINVYCFLLTQRNDHKQFKLCLSFVILNMYPPWNWQLVHEHRPSHFIFQPSNFLGRKCQFQGPGNPPKIWRNGPNLIRRELNPLGHRTRGLGNVCKGTSDHYLDVSEK